MSKVCNGCGVDKVLSEFYTHKYTKDGYRPKCKVCIHAESKLWAKRNKDKVKAYRNKRRYGLTEEQYNLKVSEQNNSCQICKRHADDDFRGVLSIDHNHIASSVRGLLCSFCNSGLGFFDENINYMENAILYLEQCKADRKEEKKNAKKSAE